MTETIRLTSLSHGAGGRPLLALNLTAWPVPRLPLELLAQVLGGGAEIAAQAGCVVVGGHSIDDPEPKYGLAVVGLADPGRLLRVDRARPGDRLVLTKALGTGVVATALKRGAADGGGGGDGGVDGCAESGGGGGGIGGWGGGGH